MPNLIPLAVPFLTALIALGAYLYRNRIAYTIVSISGNPRKENKEITVIARWGEVQAERLTVKNFGLRALENLELHLKMPDEPVALEIDEPSTISRRAVEATWADKTLRIVIPNLPRGEELKIDCLRVGHYVPSHDRLRVPAVDTRSLIESGLSSSGSWSSTS